MEFKSKVLNSVRFSPNPWVPNRKEFYKPAHSTFVSSEERKKISINMCRLCLLFPTIKIHYIFKILKLHHFNVTETIDTLLFIRTVQKQTRHGRYFNQNLTPEQYLRKFTCARCVPFKRKPVLELILEEDIVKEERNILPNITFGNNDTTIFYEHELNLDLPSAQVSKELNIVPSERFEEPVTNEEILHVVDPVTPIPSVSNNQSIKLRVLRQTSGQYSSQFV